MKIASSRIWLLEFHRIGFEIEIFNTFVAGNGGGRVLGAGERRGMHPQQDMNPCWIEYEYEYE